MVYDAWLFEANRQIGSQITTGDLRPGHERWVYGRAGAPCRRCRTPIRRQGAEPGADGERVTYWCPHCQPAAG
jgi:endonuclease VIII